jgi:hypothetical protein
LFKSTHLVQEKNNHSSVETQLTSNRRSVETQLTSIKLKEDGKEMSEQDSNGRRNMSIARKSDSD